MSRKQFGVSAADKRVLVVRALVIKSIFDVLFVVVLVAHFFYTDFNPLLPPSRTRRRETEDLDD
jgi:hypothetical protein